MPRRVALVIAVAAVCTFAGTPIAAKESVETLEVKDFKRVRSSQRTVVWCWAACIEMMANYLSSDLVVAQEQIVTRNYGMPVAKPAYSWEQIRRNLDVHLPNAKGRDLQLKARAVHGPLSPAAVEKELRGKRPFLVGVNGQSHVVVCYGARIKTRGDGSKIVDAIHIFDPWPTKSDQWLNRKEWPSHASYRWETSIVVRAKKTRYYSHPRQLETRVRGFRSQVLARTAGGCRIRMDWVPISETPPKAVWTRVFTRHAQTGQPIWTDHRCAIVAPLRKGYPAFLLFDTRIVTPTQVNLLALEF